MNLSLYKVADEYLSVFNSLVESEEDLPLDVINDTMESISGDVEERAINVAAYYKNLQKEALAMKSYEKEIRERRRRVENRSERLREYLKSNMERCGINKINSVEFTLSIRNSPASVVVDNVDVIPEEYLEKVVKVDKIKIKMAIQDGHEVPGAFLSSGTSLTIK